MEIKELEIPTETINLLTPEQAWHYFVVPKEILNGSAKILMSDDGNQKIDVDELEVVLGKKILVEKIVHEELLKNLNRYYRRKDAGTVKQVMSGTRSDDFLIQLIGEAKQLGSSDIHIEMYEQKCRVRIRIDGQLIERYTLNRNDYPALINKIKIKANLDISEKRLPQDGRIIFNQDGEKFDIRVSILPTLYGEKVVMRLLSKDAVNIDIKKLGFTDEELERYLEGIKKPNGIVLISGPTGSGKTTTLYATLKILNKETVNILTIEDPIEYTLDGINQTQLKESIGLTFGAALRTFLRQDPDVIMLGEIRDPETAQMAVRAALTGHLVLSTIHTNSAWGTISRLRDMGVPSFLLAGTLNTSVAQRLVRVLCSQCKVKKDFSETLLPKNFKAPRSIKFHYVHGGCQNCYFTGYKGRKAVYEIIPIDPELVEKIKSNENDVFKELKERNIKTLGDNCFELIENGITSIDEAYALMMQNE